ncbi:hypothetical protein CC78DRAFT_548609 [Lojkania enalia]|uniref:Uncharacterized protein n=1 Tax=Lojkania enalia TaxID=147567 RepID=A0A9P4N1T4_9PLEO|nr:hypothetical protein CC78DRAFT_548609 [Didymosphaeria enalia]
MRSPAIIFTIYLPLILALSQPERSQQLRFYLDSLDKAIDARSNNIGAFPTPAPQRYPTAMLEKTMTRVREMRAKATPRETREGRAKKKIMTMKKRKATEAGAMARVITKARTMARAKIKVKAMVRAMERAKAKIEIKEAIRAETTNWKAKKVNMEATKEAFQGEYSESKGQLRGQIVREVTI